MSGRHRKSTNTVAVRLARVGALTVMAASPLVFTGTAMAAPSSDDDESVDAVDDGYASTWSDDSDEDDSDRASTSSAKHHSFDDEDYSDTLREHDNVRSEAREASATKKRAASTAKRRATSAAGSGSSRAQDAKWDKLAKCESTQNWDANTGNGFKGGLQFTDSTWRSYGGHKYASSADKASREEQIAVAKKVQSGQGWNAWPSCSRKLGYS